MNSFLNVYLGIHQGCVRRFLCQKRIHGIFCNRKPLKRGKLCGAIAETRGGHFGWTWNPKSSLSPSFLHSSVQRVGKPHHLPTKCSLKRSPLFSSAAAPVRPRAVQDTLSCCNILLAGHVVSRDKALPDSLAARVHGVVGWSREGSALSGEEHCLRAPPARSCWLPRGRVWH